MTKLVWAFLSVLAGILIGLSLTTLAVERSPDFGVHRAGAWISRPKIGSVEADPYSKALMAARGEVPLATAEGLQLQATHDSAGQPLAGRCTYRVAGPMPPAGYWTLTVYRGDGSTAEASGLRGGYTSSEILLYEGANPVILLSPDPQPGNWLPLQPGLDFEIMLRLYDTQVTSNLGALDAGSVPAITRQACR